LAELTDSWTAVDDKTFTLKLKKPFSLTLDALAKPSSNVPFIMPERVAKTDAFTQITESIGSGPFKLVKEEWVPGNHVVFVENTDPLGSMGILRFNQLLPPFDNPKMRQALLYLVNQRDYALAIAGSDKQGKPCPSFFTCGSPAESKVGSEVLTGKRDPEKAKQLIKEAGYKGDKIVV